MIGVGETGVQDDKKAGAGVLCKGVLTKGVLAHKGFTLIELLIILAILGIMAVIAVPTIGSVRDSSRERQDVVQMELYQKAIDSYAFTDYTSVMYSQKVDVLAEQSKGRYVNGVLQYSDFPALSAGEIRALESSGRGKGLTTSYAAVAVIKVYTGKEPIGPAKVGYSFYYNTLTRKVECRAANLIQTGLLVIV